MGLEKIGKRIREERINRGLTQEQLAEQADISLNFMSLIENGKNMSVQTLLKISVALDVPVDSLLDEVSNYTHNVIIQQICSNLSSLSNDEQVYFLNTIKLYKALNKNTADSNKC